MLEILNDSTNYQDNQSKAEVYGKFIENYQAKSFDMVFASLVLIIIIIPICCPKFQIRTILS